MMRNHKIVSTVNAMSLLGFVAQKIFSLFFINLTLPLFVTFHPSKLVSASFQTTLA